MRVRREEKRAQGGAESQEAGREDLGPQEREGDQGREGGMRAGNRLEPLLPPHLLPIVPQRRSNPPSPCRSRASQG